MRSWLNTALAQAPGIYTRLLGRRRRVNCEKLAFLAVIRRGDVVFDVGANNGNYTLLFSHLMGRRGQVHAFEPVPPTFGLLKANVERECRFDNVVLNNCALAAADGSLPLFVPQSDHGQASMDDPRRELSALQSSANLICAVPEAHGARLSRLLVAVRSADSTRRPAPESGLGASP